MQPASIIIVENNTDVRDSLRHAFEDHGYRTWTCPGPEMAESIFDAVQPNVVLLDLDLEGAHPYQMMDSWRTQCPHMCVIVESEQADAGRVREAMDHGAQAFLVKTHPLTSLFALLEQMAA
jgi:DNA-binding NtrC family response regulator